MKKWLMRVLELVGIYVAAFFLAPVMSGSGDLSEYTEPFYWLKILITFLSVYVCVLYFTEWNPRHHVMIWETGGRMALCGVLTVVYLVIWIELAVLLAGLSDTWVMKWIFVGMWVLSLPIAFYFLYYRGVTVYRNGTVRVLRIGVVTYRNATLDAVTVEECGKGAKLHVVINGVDHVFRATKRDAVRYGSIIRQRVRQNPRCR